MLKISRSGRLTGYILAHHHYNYKSSCRSLQKGTETNFVTQFNIHNVYYIQYVLCTLHQFESIYCIAICTAAYSALFAPLTILTHVLTHTTNYVIDALTAMITNHVVIIIIIITIIIILIILIKIYSRCIHKYRLTNIKDDQ